MKLSVIVPTRNRATSLDACLKSLVDQTLGHGEFETIVVDNGSTDTTAQVAQKYAKNLCLRYLYEPEPGLHVGRHAGMEAAQCEQLVFCDDDIVAERTWLDSIWKAFRDADVAMVGGNNLPLFEASPPSWLLRWWKHRARLGRVISELSILDFGCGTFDIDPKWIWGCNFAIRRAVLRAAGGFHPDSLPRDRWRFRGDGETAVSAAVRQAGRRSRFHSGASVRHRVPASRMEPEYFFTRSYAQGISDSYTDVRCNSGRRSRRMATIRRLHAYLSLVHAAQVSGSDSAGRKLRSVRRKCVNRYLAGYAYHQHEVAHDEALRRWVLQLNYF